MKAILLARVSNVKQDSNEAQMVRISDYIKHKDLSVWKTYEIEESSTRGDRLQFQTIVKEIKKSLECIALVVDTVDRLQRSFKESVLLDDLRKEGKIEIHFYRENLIIHKDSNSADLLRWDMAVMFARSYILQLSDNVTRKFDQKRLNGEWIGKAPVGYMYTGEGRNKDIIFDLQKSYLVRRLFELYATGNYSIDTLRDQINKEGLRGARGTPLAKSKVYFILNNPFYYGHMRSVGKLFPHRYVPLITKELFDACQSIQKGWKKKPFQYAAKPFIFRGLLRCDICGCAMSPELKKGKYTYYSCTNARKEICNTKTYVPETTLLKPIYEVLEVFKHIPEETISAIIAIIKSSNEHKKTYNKDSILTLRSEYDDIQIKLNRLTDLLLEQTIPTAVYEEKFKELKSRQVDINIQVENHTQGDESYHITASTVLRLAKNAHELFESSEPMKKRALLNFLLQNCTVREKTLYFSLRSPFNTIYEQVNSHSMLPQLDVFTTIDWQGIQSSLDSFNQHLSTLQDSTAVAT